MNDYIIEWINQAIGYTWYNWINLIKQIHIKYYYVPGTVLSSKYITVNKIDRIFALIDLNSLTITLSFGFCYEIY